MFTNRKRSWVWMGGLLLALVGGALAASIAVGERPLHGRGGLLLVRGPMAPPARPSRRTSQRPSAWGFTSSNTIPEPGDAFEGVDEVALQQA